MVEAGAREVSEKDVVGALEAAHAAIKQLVAAIDELKAAVGKKKLTVAAKEVDQAFHKTVHDKSFGPLGDAMRILNKLESYSRVDTVLDDLLDALDEEQHAEAKHIFHEMQGKVLRDEVLNKGHRLDGRKFDKIRPIWAGATVRPRWHRRVVFHHGAARACATS